MGASHLICFFSQNASVFIRVSNTHKRHLTILYGKQNLIRKLCTYIYQHTGCDVTVLFRMRASVEAWVLEEKPDPSGFKLPAMCLRSQKYQKSQTEQIVGFAGLKHIKRHELQPQIVREISNCSFLSPPDVNRGACSWRAPHCSVCHHGRTSRQAVYGRTEAGRPRKFWGVHPGARPASSGPASRAASLH